jgi:hypothetical protein
MPQPLAVTAEDVAGTLAALLQQFDVASQVGISLLLAKTVLRQIPATLRAETAKDFATQVQKLYDA